MKRRNYSRRFFRSSIRTGVERQKGDKSETIGSLPKISRDDPRRSNEEGTCAVDGKKMKRRNDFRRCLRSSIITGVERQKVDKSETIGSLPKKPQGRPKEVE